MTLPIGKYVDWRIVMFGCVVLLSFSNFIIGIPDLSRPYIVGLICTFSLFASITQSKTDGLALGSMSVLLILMLFLLVCHSLFANNVPFPANRHLVNVLSLCCIYYTLYPLFRKNFETATRHLSILVLLFGLVVVGEYVYIVFIQGRMYDGHGLLGQRHLLGAYLLVSTGLVLQFSTWRKIYVIIYTILVLIIICTLESRITLVSALLGISLFGLLHRPKLLTIRNLLLLALILLALISGLYYIRPESVQGRFLLWRIAWSAVDMQHLLFGHGIGSVEYKVAAFQAAYLHGASMEERLLAGEVKTVMNEYLKFLLEIGLLGCLLLGYLLIRATKVLHRGGHLYLVAGLAAVLMQALASYPFYALPVSILCTVIISIAASVDREGSYFHFTITTGQRRVLIVISFLAIGWSGAQKLVYLYHQYKWADLVKNFDYKFNEPIFHNEYRTLGGILGYEPVFLEDYAVKLQSLSYFGEADSVLRQLVRLQPTARRYMLLGYNQEMQQLYKEADSSYRNAIDILPKSFLPKYLLFDMYRELGHKSEAIRIGLDMLHHPVKVPSAKVTEMRADVTEFLNLNYILHEKN